MLWPEEWYEWSVCSASCDGGTKRATLRLPSVYNHRRNNHWMNWANQRLTWLDDIVTVHCSCSCILIKPPCLFEAENAMLPLPLKTGEGRKSLICFDKLACLLGSRCKCVSTVYLLFVTAFAWPLTKARSRQELFSSWWAAYFEDLSVRGITVRCMLYGQFQGRAIRCPVKRLAWMVQDSEHVRSRMPALRSSWKHSDADTKDIHIALSKLRCYQHFGSMDSCCYYCNHYHDYYQSLD